MKNGLGPWTIALNFWNTDPAKTDTYWHWLNLCYHWTKASLRDWCLTKHTSNQLCPGYSRWNYFICLIIGDSLIQLVTHIPQRYTEDLSWELILTQASVKLGEPRTRQVRFFHCHMFFKPREGYLLKRMPDIFVKIRHGMTGMFIDCTEFNFQHT